MNMPYPKVEQNGNVKVITFTPGKIRDLENTIARELVGHTEQLGESHLLLDFTNVELLSSVELGTLVGLHKKIKATGGRLTLFNLKPEIYEIFAVTHLNSLLGICREEPDSPAKTPEAQMPFKTTTPPITSRTHG